jgi:hypothetical protein
LTDVEGVDSQKVGHSGLEPLILTDFLGNISPDRHTERSCFGHGRVYCLKAGSKVGHFLLSDANLTDFSRTHTVLVGQASSFALPLTDFFENHTFLSVREGKKLLLRPTWPVLTEK